MCGIAGFSGPYSKQSLLQMMDLMVHRGPDGEGHFFVEEGSHNTGMGHRRLSIIDLEHGQQPIWNEENNIAIIYNGEIYNYRELRERLISLGHRFKTKSDSEVILHGYETYGTRVVEHLEGMFAFAIWDKKNRRWFLARDRFGIKPLYYTLPQGRNFIFASEIKPLLSIVRQSSLHLGGFYHFLLYGFTSSEETIFKDIYQLKPAHWLVWEDGKIAKQQYWQFNNNGDRFTRTQWAELLRSRLYDAVSSHLVADVPVGITLSGGLDSSSVLAMMTHAYQGRKKIDSFTISYGRADDETPFARLMSRHCQTNQFEMQVSLKDVVDNYDKIIWHLEEPLAHTALGTTYFFGQLASRHCKVILVGEGSDELFGGYPHFKLFTLPYSLAPKPVHHHFYNGAAYIMPSARSLNKLLSPPMLNKELLDEISHTYDWYFQKYSRPQASIYADIENPLTYNQLARIDRLTMAHSVEARVPFLDRRFAETAFNCPFSFKVNGGVHKKILREAMKNDLPDKVQHRPKTDKKEGSQAIMPSLVQAFLNSGKADFLSDKSIKNRGWFDLVTVKTYLNESNSFRVRYHPIESRRRQKFSLALIALENWARLFLDGAHTQPQFQTRPSAKTTAGSDQASARF